MNVNPFNLKKYMVWGHQLEEICKVIDALALVCRLGEEDDPPEAAHSVISLARGSLCNLTDRIQDGQEITEDVDREGQEARG